jgi:hypothetical protein
MAISNSTLYLRRGPGDRRRLPSDRVARCCNLRGQVPILLDQHGRHECVQRLDPAREKREVKQRARRLFHPLEVHDARAQLGEFGGRQRLAPPQFAQVGPHGVERRRVDRKGQQRLRVG